MKNLLTVLLVLLVISLTSFTKEENPSHIRESINTLEDMKEWMLYDIELNDIDKEKGSLYIRNIDLVLLRLNQLK